MLFFNNFLVPGQTRGVIYLKKKKQKKQTIINLNGKNCIFEWTKWDSNSKIRIH